MNTARRVQRVYIWRFGEDGHRTSLFARVQCGLNLKFAVFTLALGSLMFVLIKIAKDPKGESTALIARVGLFGAISLMLLFIALFVLFLLLLMPVFDIDALFSD